jgi:hypothetical protein
MPDWLLERIFPYTPPALLSSKTVANMNTTTLKFIAVGVAGGLLGFVAARIYFSSWSAVHAHEEKSMEPVELAELAESAEPAELAEPAESVESVEPAESVEPVEPVEPVPPISSIEQIDTSNPFNNKKFDPILDDKEYVIGFMYKLDALKKALSRPPVSIPKKTQNPIKIGYATFDRKTRDLRL